MKIKEGLIALGLIYFSMFCAIASADSRLECLKDLSVTEKPVFSGLVITKFDRGRHASSEGGEFQLFADSSGRLVYILVIDYGETGKRVALYKLLNGATHSFAARVSNYKYMEPIYAGPARVVSVNTSSFIVCNGSASDGVGSIDVSEEVVTTSMKDVSEAAETYQSRKRKSSEQRRLR
jgi:hypothetical protein